MHAQPKHSCVRYRLFSHNVVTMETSATGWPPWLITFWYLLISEELYSLVQWNWLSAVTGWTWVTCISDVREPIHCTSLYILLDPVYCAVTWFLQIERLKMESIKVAILHWFPWSLRYVKLVNCRYICKERIFVTVTISHLLTDCVVLSWGGCLQQSIAVPAYR